MQTAVFRASKAINRTTGSRQLILSLRRSKDEQPALISDRSNKRWPYVSHHGAEQSMYRACVLGSRYGQKYYTMVAGGDWR